jgi:rRNA-processing protein FCF1
LEPDVKVIVYVETNFLMSVATGREERGNELLDAVSGSVRVAIPSGCFMESFSALEAQRRSRNRFRDELESQIKELRRDITSANARTLLGRLEESKIASEGLLNDVQARLFQVVDRAANVLEPIPETPFIIQSAVSSILISDPTDNLILCSILDHASHFPEAVKSLLTENTNDFDTPEVRSALAEVGIDTSFRSVTNLLGWLGSLPQ